MKLLPSNVRYLWCPKYWIFVVVAATTAISNSNTKRYIVITCKFKYLLCMLQFPQPQTPYHLSDHIQTQLLKERYRTDNSYYTEYTIKQKSTLHRLCDQTQEAKHITKIRLGTTVNINNERETERGKDRGSQTGGKRCEK